MLLKRQVLKVISHFIVSEKLKFKIFNLEKVGQGHEVYFSQLHHSMTYVKMYKCLCDIFALALTVSEI